MRMPDRASRPRGRTGIKAVTSPPFPFEAQGRFTFRATYGGGCAWRVAYPPLKLWGKSPNPAAESVGCERSNLPASSVSLLVEERAKKPFPGPSILDWLAGSMLKHSNVNGSSKLLTEWSLFFLCLHQPIFFFGIKRNK